MNQRWYADPRDLIKWATLLHIGQRAGTSTIVQVGFVTATGSRPTIDFGAGRFAVQDTVWQHFRSLLDATRLSSDSLTIDVYDRPFSHAGRQQYIVDAIAHLGRIEGTKLVFLDPDTGLTHVARGPQHVSVAEVGQFWAALRSADCLVLYQHAWRARNWVDQARRRFGNAISVSEPWMYRGTSVGRDVVSLAARRETASSV